MTDHPTPPQGPPPFQGPNWPPPQPGHSSGGSSGGPQSPPPHGAQGPQGPHPPAGFPPPYWRPQRPQPKRNNGLVAILLIIAVTAGIYLVLNAGKRGTTGFSGGTTSNGLQEVITDAPANSSYKVAVVDISGIIIEGGQDLFPIPGFATADPVGMLRDSLDRVTADPRVKGLVLRINSPGGGLTDSDVLYHEISKRRDEWASAGRQVLLVVLMGDVAASGGYMISAPADQIFAHPTTLTGSIGVILSGWNYAGLMQQHGVDDATVTSVPHKDMGSPFRRPEPFETEWFERLLQEMHEQFVDAVWQGRSRVVPTLTRADVAKWADGRVFTASQAKAMQMIDQIGYQEDAIQWVASRINPNERPTVVQYQRETPSLSLLPFGQTPADSPMSAADWATQLQLLRQQLERSRSPLPAAGPRVWALWPGR